MSTYTGIPLLTLSGVRDSISQAVADGATTEVAASCYYDKLKDILQYNPSWVMMPSFLKDGKAYTMISGLSGSLNVTRTTTPTASRATRVNASGFIETVTDNVLRLDYPIGGGCPAALIEPSGTNFARWVNQMTSQDTPTASGGMTITTGSTDFLAPDGTSGSITKYVGGAASGTSQYAYYSGGGIIFTASGQHTFSLFVKRGATNPLTFCALSFVNYTGGSGTSPSYFNLASGTALTAGASVQDYGNGWYRLISAPYTIASGDLDGQLLFWMAEGNGDLSWPASGALNLTAYTWGAQVEAGSIATTYIPTTTTTASRAADVISASGALVSGLIGATEGTIYWEGSINRQDRVIFSLAQGTSITNAIFLQTLSNGFFRADVIVNNTTTCAISSLAVSTIGQFYKIAFAYKENDFAFYINGVQQGLDSSGALPTGLTNAIFARGDSSLITNQRCRAAALYTTRLTNDQLANLTRLT